MFSDRLFSCRDGSTLYHAAVAFCGPTAWDTGGKFWPMFCDYICTLSSLHRFWAPARYWSKTAFSCWCAFGAPTPLLRVPLPIRAHAQTDGQPENILPPAPTTKWADTYNKPWTNKSKSRTPISTANVKSRVKSCNNRTDSRIPRTVYRYFWAYPFLFCSLSTLLSSYSPLFLFHAVD